MRPRPRLYIGSLLLGLVVALPTHPVRDSGDRRREAEAQASDELAELAADAVLQAREYRASLERVLALREAEVSRAARLVESRERLYRDALVSRAELAQTQQALARARADAEETRHGIAEADRLVAEASALEQLATLPPPPVGGQVTTDTLVRYNGPAGWSLAETPRLARFFESRFGRPLPLSAVGQTVAHDRLGFDHREAIDVAVHPDSAEGRALLEHLRSLGIPFLAFRSVVAGAATGAHIHVGLPSRRVGLAR